MVDSEPFGQRAIRLGLATSDQVRQALETQRLLAEKTGILGEVLVERGLLDPVRYIEIVQQLAEEEHAPDHTTAQQRFIEIALSKGYVTPHQVEEGRRIQSTSPRPNKVIGQIMVEMGIMDPLDRDKVLATYSNAKTH